MLSYSTNTLHLGTDRQCNLQVGALLKEQCYASGATFMPFCFVILKSMILDLPGRKESSHFTQFYISIYMYRVSQKTPVSKKNLLSDREGKQC